MIAMKRFCGMIYRNKTFISLKVYDAILMI